MANNLGSLVVSLGLDAAEFTKGLSKSDYQAQKFAQNVQRGIEAARLAVVAYAGAAVAALAVVNRQAENVASYQNMAEKIGDSAEAVASLKLASDVSGVSLDTMSAASIKLTAALSKTDDESKGVGKALGAIGLEMEAFKRLSPVEQIDAVAKAMGGYADGSEKTAVAVQLFGKSGAELIPLLNDLAKGSERQITLTNEQIEAADKYSKQTARLSSEIEILTQRTAADAVPVLSQMTGILSDVFHASTDASTGIGLLSSILGGAKTVLETTVVLGANVAYVFKAVGIEIGGMAAQIGALLRLDFKGFTAISDAMKEDAERARREVDRFSKQIIDPVRFGADDQSSAEAQRLGLSTPKSTINFRPDAPAGNKLDKAAADAKRLREEDLRGWVAYADAVLAEGERVDTALRQIDEDANRYREQMRKKDLDGWVAYAEARINEDFETAKTLADSLSKSTDEAANMAKRLGDAFASTFDSAFRDGMKFGDLLKKLAFDAINIQFLTPSIKKGSDFLGGLLGKVFSFAGGGYTGSGSRSGGLDGQGGYMAMLHPQETVVDHTRPGSAGNGVVINQSVSIDARGADAGVEAKIRAAMEQTRKQTIAEVQALANRGGGFSRAMGRA